MGTLLEQSSELHIHHFYKLHLLGQSDRWLFVNSYKRTAEQGNKIYWLFKCGLMTIKVFKLIKEIVNRIRHCYGLLTVMA